MVYHQIRSDRNHSGDYCVVRNLQVWEKISNGQLLKLAEETGFDLLLTTDKNLRYQQNLADRKISIVVLGQSPWWLVRLHLEAIAADVNAARPSSYIEVEIPFGEKT